MGICGRILDRGVRRGRFLAGGIAKQYLQLSNLHSTLQTTRHLRSDTTASKDYEKRRSWTLQTERARRLGAAAVHTQRSGSDPLPFLSVTCQTRSLRACCAQPPHPTPRASCAQHDDFNL